MPPMNVTPSNLNSNSIRIAPACPTKLYDVFWSFAAERQGIFFKRFQGEQRPWTTDLVLQKYKFTNAYRASDRVSQYLIRNVVYGGSEEFTDVFFRTLLFKFFNRISTWELLVKEFDTINYSEFSIDAYDAVLERAMQEGTRLFSAAYVMPAGSGVFVCARKHRSYLKLLDRMMSDEVPAQIQAMPKMRNAFELLRSYPMIGDFLAYQYIIDLNYSSALGFDENEFVVPGPGALSGLRKCFSSYGGLAERDLIRILAEKQEEEFAARGIEFKTLWGRKLHLIDCQNLLCEVDKYARVAFPDIIGIGKRSRIKQLFNPSTDTPISHWYPPKWNLNENIAKERSCACDSR